MKHQASAIVPKVGAHTGTVYASRTEIGRSAKVGVLPSAEDIGNEGAVIKIIEGRIIGGKSGKIILYSFNLPFEI